MPVWWALLLGCHGEVRLDSDPILLSTDPTATLEVDVDQDALLALTLRTNGWIALDSVDGPGVSRRWEDEPGTEQSSTAFSEQPLELVHHQRVSPGSWRFVLSTSNEAGEPTPLQVNGWLDLQRGRGDRLEVLVRLSRGLTLPDAAIDRLVDIYASAGLDLFVDVENSDLPDVAPDVETNPSLLATAAAPGPMVVWVAAELEGSAIGRAGNLPGASRPGARALITIAHDEYAGVDGELDVPEAMLLGEGIAHEIGHYLGLFHPVELSWDRYDALDSTPTCSASTDCQARLGNNLMYPLPGGARLTNEQRNVIRRHPLVR